MTETMPNGGTLSDYEKRQLTEAKLLDMLTRLSKRNQSLTRYVIMKSCVCWDKIGSETINSLQPKRGKKPKEGWSIAFIMKVAHCSRRSAFDYRLAFLAEKLAEEILWGHYEWGGDWLKRVPSKG